jgi:hypothetical protein
MKAAVQKGRVSVVNKYIRLTIMIAVVLGIVFVAQNQVAWANQAPAPGLSVRADGPSVVSAAKENCKDKNKNKDKCQGSVKPPPKSLLIPVTGEYSVGGFCTLSITFNDPAVTLDATLQTPLPRDLPDKVHKVSQGCLLTYYSSQQRIDEVSASAGSAKICFAAIPQQISVVYFYNLYAANAAWVPLETTVENGIACAAGPKSGVYVATFETP